MSSFHSAFILGQSLLLELDALTWASCFQAPVPTPEAGKPILLHISQMATLRLGGGLRLIQGLEWKLVLQLVTEALLQTLFTQRRCQIESHVE